MANKIKTTVVRGKVDAKQTTKSSGPIRSTAKFASNRGRKLKINVRRG